MDEENKKVKKEKKPATFKTLFMRRFIFILIFAIIIGGTTTYFVIKNKPEKETKNESEELALDNEVPTVPARENHKSLINYDTDTFDCNDLEVNEISDNFEGYKVRYFQIDGLKDKSIQDSINNNLKNDLKEAVSQAKADGSIKGECYVSSLYSSSFANTLSILYSLDSYIIDQKTYEYTYYWEKSICENYDLTTGNRIKIQDIFTDDTRGSDIFDSTFYNELIKGYTDTDLDEEEYNMLVKDYKDIEEKMLDYILKFDSDQDIPFYFSEQEITFPNYYARIFYEDHLDFVAIYNKYKTQESIFDGRYQGIHNLPVLTKRYNSYRQILDEGENYYIDFNLEKSIFDDNVDEKVLNAVLNYINSDAESVKSLGNNGKFYIYNTSYFLARHEGDNYYSLNTNTYKCETTKSLFNSEIKPRIVNAFRKSARIPTGEARLYDNQFVYYLYEDEENGYEKVNKDWENESSEIFFDLEGNIYETREEAMNPGGIEIKD